MLHKVIKNVLIVTKNAAILHPSIRNYATTKRFYKKTDILKSYGKYEVTLDQRKLKTPAGRSFEVDTEPLALAVAAEWDAQKGNIQQTTMHLNALCCTVIDNPNNLRKYDMVNYIVNYLPTDAILYQSAEDDRLYDLQCKEWDPILEWFCKRFDVKIEKSRTISAPVISSDAKVAVTNHLAAYNFAALQGFVYAVDCVKSPILALACSEKYILPQKAVLLSRLEEEFQLGHWGRVEWAHDMSQWDLQSRLAASMLFIRCNAFQMIQEEKKKQQNVV